MEIKYSVLIQFTLINLYRNHLIDFLFIILFIWITVMDDKFMYPILFSFVFEHYYS